MELPVPKPKRAVIGPIILTGLILFFISLAIYDLSHAMAIIPSVLWLLLVGAMLIGFIKEKGMRQLATDSLGAFSFKELAWITLLENDRAEFQYGFQMFTLRFSYFRVAVERIVRVNWSTGQASHFARKDVGDWQVAVWYEHGDPVKSQKHRLLKYPDQDLYIIGLCAPKDKTAALGCALLDLLKKSGTPFTQGESDCIFIRQLNPVG